jgi:hypothetical protein
MMKRLHEIKERILEADIWSDMVFLRYMDQLRTSTVQTYDTEVSRIYQNVYRSKNKISNEQIVRHGTEVVLHSFFDLSQLRLTYYTTHSGIYEKTSQVVFIKLDIIDKTYRRACRPFQIRIIFNPSFGCYIACQYLYFNAT